jgi:hypothetical protein
MSNSSPSFARLNNSNYNEWKDNMKAWLQRSGVWRIVNGEETKPGPDKPAELSAWLQRSDRAAGEMKLMVEPDQRTHFLLECRQFLGAGRTLEPIRPSI